MLTLSRARAGFALITRNLIARNLPPLALIAAALITALITALASAPTAHAQVSNIQLNVDPADVGFAGVLNYGQWQPMRVTLTNPGADNRPVILRWVLDDIDGDQVHAQRDVNLAPGRTQSVWLYAPISVNENPGRRWLVQALDAQAGGLIDQQIVGSLESRPLSRGVGRVAVCSTADLGLSPYTNEHVRHEPLVLHRGVTLRALPDRWYGLASLQAIVWTREGGDPGDPAVTAEQHRALREWVRRGGHLVIVLPPVGEPWSQSPLADLLPIDPDRMRLKDRFDPGNLGTVRSAELFTVPARVFDLPIDARTPAGNSLAVLDRDDPIDPTAGDPYIVAGRYGFGRVTLIGVDLTNRQLVRAGLPNGRTTLWNNVFQWQTPAYTRTYIDAETKAGNIARPDLRSDVALGGFIASRIAQTQAAAVNILLAMAAFGVYWLLAGPLGWLLLKQRAMLQHAWLAFAATAAAASLVFWGAAAFLQPGTLSARHFSVVDLDIQTNQAHVQSWLSAFFPAFGNAPIAVEDADPLHHHTLASMGVTRDFAGEFLDSQAYRVNAAAPHGHRVPIRATAKQFNADYFGPIAARAIDQPNPGTPNAPAQPAVTGSVTMSDRFFPIVNLTHHFPATLRDVRFVLCADDDQPPQTWRPAAGQRDWEPGQPLVWGGGVPSQADHDYDRLVRRHGNNFPAERSHRLEGLLGHYLADVSGGLLNFQSPAEVGPAQPVNIDRVRRQLDVLTFFDALPPPNFRVNNFNTAANFKRPVGQSLDLTALTAGSRLIILAHAEDAPLPLPTSINDQHPPTQGLTFFRLVYELP